MTEEDPHAALFAHAARLLPALNASPTFELPTELGETFATMSQRLQPESGVPGCPSLDGRGRFTPGLTYVPAQRNPRQLPGRARSDVLPPRSSERNRSGSQSHGPARRRCVRVAAAP